MDSTQANQERDAPGTFPDCMFGEDRTKRLPGATIVWFETVAEYSAHSLD